VQIPDSVLPEKVIGEALIPRTDFLIAETSVVHLLSHHHLHRRKRSEQNNRCDESNFVKWHNGKF
jgi:hypothetical protein